MKLNFLLSVLCCLFFISSCKNEEESTVENTIAPLNSDNLFAQSFSINGGRDTVIIGAQGTQLRIYKNTFVDKNGNPVTGTIEFELKEALTRADILLSGLTTTSDGKALETGGMVYTNATANGEAIAIAPQKYIGIAIPSKEVQAHMQIFTGVPDSNGINWVAPYATLNYKLEKAERLKESTREETKRIEKKGVSESDIDAIMEYVNSDSAKTDSFAAFVEVNPFLNLPEKRYLNDIRNKGSNEGLIDPNTAYIFAVQKLGWINIDAFYADKRAKEIQLKVTIDNVKDFKEKDIYVSIIVDKLYLPGYQRVDNCYGFSHGDEEPTVLPIGAEATIIATAKKGNQLYFEKQTFTIQFEQNISVRLKETSQEQLKAALQ